MDIIIIHEDKKYGQPRQIFPEKEIMTMATRKSFKNWIDKWRPKVENQYSGDSLFLLPSGKPFKKDYLRTQLSERGKHIWNAYHPYISRSWCAIARLIQSKVNSDHYNVYEIKDWLGHDRLKTTETYIQYAHRYYQQAPFDWIKSILKANNVLKECFGEENGLKSKESQNKVLSTEFPPVNANSSRQIRHNL
jgi:integrase